MSADNGVYILVTTDRYVQQGSFHTKAPNGGKKMYRVAHTQAIDNFNYYKEKEPHNLGWYMNSVWGDSRVHDNKQAALVEADKLQALIEYTEYGINTIDASEFNFPGY